MKREDSDEDSDEDGDKPAGGMSKKKAKQESRMAIAALKQVHSSPFHTHTHSPPPSQSHTRMASYCSPF